MGCCWYWALALKGHHHRTIISLSVKRLAVIIYLFFDLTDRWCSRVPVLPTSFGREIGFFICRAKPPLNYMRNGARNVSCHFVIPFDILAQNIFNARIRYSLCNERRIMGFYYDVDFMRLINVFLIFFLFFPFGYMRLFVCNRDKTVQRPQLSCVLLLVMWLWVGCLPHG